MFRKISVPLVVTALLLCVCFLSGCASNYKCYPDGYKCFRTYRIHPDGKTYSTGYQCYPSKMKCYKVDR